MRVKSEINRLENIKRQSTVTTFQQNGEHANKSNRSITARYTIQRGLIRVPNYSVIRISYIEYPTFVFYSFRTFNEFRIRISYSFLI